MDFLREWEAKLGIRITCSQASLAVLAIRGRLADHALDAGPADVWYCSSGKGADGHRRAARPGQGHPGRWLRRTLLCAQQARPLLPCCSLTGNPSWNRQQQQVPARQSCPEAKLVCAATSSATTR